MKTTSTRIVALAGAVAISFGAAACGNSDPAPSPAGSSAPSSTTPSAPPSSTDSPTPSDSLSSETGDSSKAADIVEKAKSNALAATSGQFGGTVEQSGEEMKISYKGTSDGKTADISIESSKQGKARIIAVPGGTYIQADAKFWKNAGAPASVQKAGAKFIKAPSSAASMTDSFSLKSFAQKAFGSVSQSDFSDEVGEETVNGVDCWVVTDKRGKQGGALYVSKDTNEVVRFTGTTTSPGQLDFSKWNEDLAIKAPPAGQIMKLG
ncbi:MAG: hypothetical protein L0H96_24840 [Humibacillus sp.]|nr:hypothetical protein [Humibacillus sp.]MDN5780111.1 hypothetical protein [Humibacillus sp.]